MNIPKVERRSRVDEDTTAVIVELEHLEELEAYAEKKDADYRGLTLLYEELEVDRDGWKMSEEACNNQYNILSDECAKVTAERDELKEAYERVLPSYRTLNAYANTKGICPECGKYRLLEGYVCFGCGYDSSYRESKK